MRMTAGGVSKPRGNAGPSTPSFAMKLRLTSFRVTLSGGRLPLRDCRLEFVGFADEADGEVLEEFDGLVFVDAMFGYKAGEED